MPQHKREESSLYGPGSGDGPLGGLPGPDDMLSGPAMRDVTLGGNIEDPTSILSAPDGDVDEILSLDAHSPEVNEVGPLDLPVLGPKWLVGE